MHVASVPIAAFSICLQFYLGGDPLCICTWVCVQTGLHHHHWGRRLCCGCWQGRPARQNESYLHWRGCCSGAAGGQNSARCGCIGRECGASGMPRGCDACPSVGGHALACTGGLLQRYSVRCITASLRSSHPSMNHASSICSLNFSCCEVEPCSTCNFFWPLLAV